MNKKTILLSAFAALAALTSSGDLRVDFSRDPAQWIIVKSPRFDYCQGFTQRDGWIENVCPDVSAEEVFKKFNSAVYSGMVYREKFKTGTCVSSKMGFDYRMAPLMVIAPELGKSGKGEMEFREHWEIVLYDRGLNVWHHYMTPEGKPAWYKAASLLLSPEDVYKPNLRNDLKVKIDKNGKGLRQMTVTCGDYVLQYVDDALPDEFYAGVLGCEGRNMFYDFAASAR